MMDFQPKEDRDYRLWLVSASEAFAIGVLDYLFGQKCIQVLYREVPGGQWWVIQEWRTYEAELVDFLVSHVKVGLSVVDPNLRFGQWKEVEDLLPPKEAKYLEDEGWLKSIKKSEDLDFIEEQTEMAIEAEILDEDTGLPKEAQDGSPT